MRLLDIQQLQESALHLVLVAKGKVAEDQVEASHEVEMLSSMHQQVLV